MSRFYLRLVFLPALRGSAAPQPCWLGSAGRMEEKDVSDPAAGPAADQHPPDIFTAAAAHPSSQQVLLKAPTDRWTDGWTDGWTNGQTSF